MPTARKTKTNLENTRLSGFRGFVIRIPSGQYLGLDHDSGGYPFVAHGIRDIFVWATLEDAMRYKDIFLGSSGFGKVSPASGWRIVEVMLVELS